MEERSTTRWQHRLKREHPTCTDRTNRSTKSADGRVATVATRREKNLVQRKNKRILLTPTGLLMEGHSTQKSPPPGVMSVIAMFRHSANLHRSLCVGCANWQSLNSDVPACLGLARVGLEVNFVSLHQHTSELYLTLVAAAQNSVFLVNTGPRWILRQLSSFCANSPSFFRRPFVLAFR